MQKVIYYLCIISSVTSIFATSIVLSNINNIESSSNNMPDFSNSYGDCVKYVLSKQTNTEEKIDYQGIKDICFNVIKDKELRISSDS